MISEICIYDVADASVRSVFQTRQHIEAPNWHGDGYLVVNGGGAVYRVPLDAPELIRIDTGFATRLNNDHGLSPDGTQLAISDKVETGESCIYTLPVGGGPLHRVTKSVPSWWHGWSPDGARMVYAGAQRGDRVVRIYTCLSTGGDERLVVDGFDHADGPDYSADGAWIWFNGEREGAVNIWRVRPDGSEVAQMTTGDSVDWFPHPSPCGAHVVYLAYPAGTVGHPGGCDVALRIMPQGGGVSRQIVTLHGGQGSLNVPCWHPDGGAFAFVRYAP